MNDKDCEKEKKVKNWGTGGGMYKGVKTSVKTLNYVIVVLVALLVIVVIYLASTSSYTATFEMNGGEAIAEEPYKYGEKVTEKLPVKTGYVFAGWYLDKDFTKEWDMASNQVEGNITLYANWRPALIHIRFDLNGGIVDGQTSIAAIDRTFHEPYNELPTPTKDGYRFVGWQYSGNIITGDTLVSMNGEHTLTAIFE